MINALTRRAVPASYRDFELRTIGKINDLLHHALTVTLVPIMVAALWSLRAPAVISEADAEPLSMSTAVGTPEHRCRQWRCRSAPPLNHVFPA